MAIADLAGGEWPAKARAAALKLSGEAEAEVDAASIGVQLLAAIKAVFDRLARTGSRRRVWQRYTPRGQRALGYHLPNSPQSIFGFFKSVDQVRDRANIN
jgi:hypothetical protein